MPESSANLLLSLTDPITRWWMRHPRRAALIGLVYSLLLAGASALLGISFKEPEEVTGFLEAENWVVMICLFPVALFLGAVFFLKVGRAVTSLDDRVLFRVSESDPPASEAFAAVFRRAWPFAIAMSAVIPLSLGAYGDGRDILSPFQWWPPTNSKDWMAAFDWTGHGHWLIYLVFNSFAFVLQASILYVAFLVLIVGLLVAWILVMPRVTEEPSVLGSYRFQWDYSDRSGRGGLGDFDGVFIAFLSFMLLTIGGSIVAVLSNASANKAGDVGSITLIVLTVLVLPIVWMYVLFSYWAKCPKGGIPEKVKADYAARGLDCYDPQPWPLGATLSLTVGALVVSGWFYMLMTAWTTIGKALNPPNAN